MRRIKRAVQWAACQSRGSKYLARGSHACDRVADVYWFNSANCQRASVKSVTARRSSCGKRVWKENSRRLGGLVRMVVSHSSGTRGFSSRKMATSLSLSECAAGTLQLRLPLPGQLPQLEFAFGQLACRLLRRFVTVQVQRHEEVGRTTDRTLVVRHGCPYRRRNAGTRSLLATRWGHET